MENNTCAICEADVSRRARTGRLPAYCSPECKAEAARRRAREWYRLHGNDPAYRVRVTAASKRHHERVKSDPVALAKQRNATAIWRSKNPEKVAAQYRKWRLANSQRVIEKNNRRRARLMSVTFEKFDPAKVWARDNGKCGVCATAIDPELAWPHKMSRTLDHVIPLSKGGTHELANVQLAHMVCNARKNNRAA